MKTLIAVPTMDMVHTMFFASVMQLKKVGDIELSVTASSLIYDARNALARKAIEGGFGRILWLDSDMMFEPDLMERLSARIDEGCEYVSALYFKRKAPIEPVIYKACGSREENGQTIPFADSYTDYPDSLFEIAASGFGGVMVTTALVKRVAETYGLPFSPILGFGEDLSFCCKVARLGVKMYCDPTIKMGHVGYHVFDENDFILKGVKQWNV